MVEDILDETERATLLCSHLHVMRMLGAFTLMPLQPVTARLPGNTSQLNPTGQRQHLEHHTAPC